MVTIFPFHAIYYNKSKIKDLSLVTAQPYDRIDSALQDVYYKRHEFNIVRITKGRDLAGDFEQSSKYRRAREYFQDWLSSEILIQYKAPAIYASYQHYKDNDTERVRKGFCCLVKLEEVNQGQIRAHERTHSAPKVDRLNLLREVKAHFGQIFMLYSDEKGVVSSLLDKFTVQEPLLESKDDYGETHRVWVVEDADTIKLIQRCMQDKIAIIADGHHRYETALNHRDELLKAGVKSKSAESYENVMATFFNMDEGLKIFPTHRAVRQTGQINPDSFVQQTRQFFEVQSYFFNSKKDEQSIRTEFLEDLRLEGLSSVAFGAIFKDSTHYFLLKLRDKKIATEVSVNTYSDDWKTLDVNVLHDLILKKILQITEDDLAHERKIDYYRDANEVIERVIYQGQYDAGFLVNPVKMDQIKKITANLERFPQKTTDFYPKLLSGLLAFRLNL